MRVLLVDNLLLENGGALDRDALQPPLGLISLLAVMEAAGHDGRLFDPKLALADGRLSLLPSLYPEMADHILDEDADTVGFTTLGCNFIVTLKVAKYLKQARPEVPILLGGPHATVLDRAILERFPQFDVIVRNEAELKILPVLDALSGLGFDRVPGITYRRGDEIVANPGEPVIDDLDQLPRHAYH